MLGIKDLPKKLIAFREERDFQQFHKPKDLAVLLLLGLVCFQR